MRRRGDLSGGAAGWRRQQAPVCPADATKDAVLKALLSEKFAMTEAVVCNLQSPKKLATLISQWDTKVTGDAGPAHTYNFDLVTMGFTANADIAQKTALTLRLVKGAITYSVTVDDTDAFSSAVGGGAGSITLDVGCAINRAAGTITVQTKAATDDLTGAKWSLSAFILENESTVRGAAPYGAGWSEKGLAKYHPDNGVIEIPHVDATGAPISTSLEEGMIYLQSVPAPAGFANTLFQAAFLISPYQHMKDHATLYYNISNDAKKVENPADGSWVALSWDDVTDLSGSTLLYTTKGLAAVMGATSYMLTLRIDMTLALPETRDGSTFVYGFAVGVN